MKQNVRIAKELIKIAKNIINSYEDYDDDDARQYKSFRQCMNYLFDMFQDDNFTQGNYFYDRGWYHNNIITFKEWNEQLLKGWTADIGVYFKSGKDLSQFNPSIQNWEDEVDDYQYHITLSASAYDGEFSFYESKTVNGLDNAIKQLKNYFKQYKKEYNNPKSKCWH